MDHDPLHTSQFSARRDAEEEWTGPDDLPAIQLDIARCNQRTARINERAARDAARNARAAQRLALLIAVVALATALITVSITVDGCAEPPAPAQPSRTWPQATTTP